MFTNFIRLASIVAALALSATPALAAPGGKNASQSSISLVTSTSAFTAAATDGPSYGDSVTFAVSTTATAQPFVHLKCFQNGSLVLESWQAWFEGGLGDRSFTLGGSPAWQSGDADCTAYLENWDSYSKNRRISVLASTSFHVNG
jgi:hypothetical protein